MARSALEGNLAELLARRSAERGWRDRPALLAGDTSYSHGAVHGGSARAAGVLHAAGVRPGDHVLIALPDTIEFVLALLGTARLGAVAVLVNPALPAAEHEYLFGDARPVVVVCAPELAGRFPAAKALPPDDLTAPPAEIPPCCPVPPDAPLYVQYTSGTTGRPKGAVHRHSDPEVYYRAMAVGALDIRPDDVLFSVSKAYFAYGLGNTVFFPLLSGAAAVLDPGRPTVTGIVELARRHRPTILFTVPTFYARLLADGDPVPFGSLRAAVSAGEPLLPALADRAAAWLGCPLLDELGTTEVGQAFVSGTPSGRRRGAIGRVLEPYQIEVRDPDGRPVPAGEQGVLHVRGPSVLLEYLNRPAETARVLGADGWLNTGDLVHLDEDGFVHHHGRVDDLEMVGGITMSPLEVERLLATHAAVSEVAVTVVGAGGAGVLRGFVVPAPGYAASPALETELLELVRARLAAYKVPRSVTFVPELPRTPTGKLRRFVLRQFHSTDHRQDRGRDDP